MSAFYDSDGRIVPGPSRPDKGEAPIPMKRPLTDNEKKAILAMLADGDVTGINRWANRVAIANSSYPDRLPGRSELGVSSGLGAKEAVMKARTRRVALVGTSPHWKDAPFSDSSWEIWASSPMLAAEGGAPRWDHWFEIHHMDPGQWNPRHLPEYRAFLMRDHGRPVWFRSPDAHKFPSAKAFPTDQVMSLFMPQFLTSSIAWMMAKAILDGDVAEIGLFGVDMLEKYEHQIQRPGCFYFMAEAARRGIKVTLASASRLRVVDKPYGAPIDHREADMRWRLKVLKERLAGEKAKFEQAKTNVAVLDGAVQSLGEAILANYGIPEPDGEDFSV